MNIKNISRDDLINIMKASLKSSNNLSPDISAIALDSLNADNMRLVIKFYNPGYFGGYVGIPKEFSSYNIDVYDDAIYNFEQNIHGGITYIDYKEPHISKDIDRRWFGFDYNHQYDKKDIKLSEEIFGVDRTSKSVYNSYFYFNDSLNPHDFKDALTDINTLVNALKDYEMDRVVKKDIE